MKRAVFVACVVTFAVLAVADEVTLDATGKILTFDVDAADYPESAPYDYTATWDSVAATVTNVSGTTRWVQTSCL